MLSQHLNLDNILKVILAIAVGILLYNVFFKKSEGYYNYQSIDKISDHAYPMDYEEDDSDIPYTDPTDDAEETEEVYEDEETEEAEEVYDNEDEVYDDEETEEVDVEAEDDIVLEDSVDEEMYEYEESADDVPYDDSADAEEATDIPDDIYEEADMEEDAVVESEDNEDEDVTVDYLYTSDAEDGLQEDFVLYEQTTGEDMGYQPLKNDYM